MRKQTNPNFRTIYNYVRLFKNANLMKGQKKKKKENVLE